MRYDAAAGERGARLEQLGERRFFEELVRASADGILAVDAVGRILYANPAAADLLGADLESIVGSDLGHPCGDDEATEIQIQNPRRGAIAVEMRVGESRLAEADVRVVTLRDVTQRVAAERAVRDKHEQLLQAQKLEAIGRLAGGVAHDFNNILSVILTTCEFAMIDLRDDDPLREDLAQIRGAGERAAALTRQLLAFSRKQRTAPRTVAINEEIERLRHMLARIIGEDIRLAFELDDGVAPVRLDPAHLGQIVLNLAVNARDAMPEGGELTISTGVLAAGDAGGERLGLARRDHAVLRVADTGLGMTDEVLQRAFEPFFTTKDEGRGTGLGLSTIHGIVKQAGGEVRVESRSGAGTTISVYLPAAAAGEAQDAPRASVEPLARGHETVLLAEDEPTIRRVIRRVLGDAGYRVLEAANPGEALLLYEQQEGEIDLLLSDVVMPLMSGPELARRLGADRGEPRVLFVSGYPDDAAMLTEGGPFADARFLPKPFTAGELLAAVREALEG